MYYKSYDLLFSYMTSNFRNKLFNVHMNFVPLINVLILYTFKSKLMRGKTIYIIKYIKILLINKTRLIRADEPDMQDTAGEVGTNS